MPQYEKEDAIYMTTHFGCTTADGYVTDASIIRYTKQAGDEGEAGTISVQEAIENLKEDCNHDFGTY